MRQAEVPRCKPYPATTPQSAMVTIDEVTMAFGDYIAVRDVNLTVGDGEFLAIVGPTGCGKSTILNAIAGLLSAASGCGFHRCRKLVNGRAERYRLPVPAGRAAALEDGN